MIPCPHCDREFDKRSGLMRHAQAAHPGAFASPADLARTVLEAEQPLEAVTLDDPLGPEERAAWEEARQRAQELAAATSGPVTVPAVHATRAEQQNVQAASPPELPLHLRQVAFRVGNGYESDQMDVRYLLRLAQIGHDLVDWCKTCGSDPYWPEGHAILARWDEAVR